MENEVTGFPLKLIPGTKITLRRQLRRGPTGLATASTIKRNLANISQNSYKKRIAQAYYYGTEEFVSPLNRPPPIDDEPPKEPVHKRLGRRRFKIHPRVNLHGTNTSALPPKMRGVTKRLQQGRATRPFSVQDRLLKYKPKANGTFNLNPHARIRLHRVVPPPPMNYTVRVDNPGFQQVAMRHSIRAQLNPQVQREIQTIQAQTTVHQLITDLPVLVMATSIGVNERFSMLP